MQSDAVNSLGVIARVNEQVKCIILDAESLFLVALNAMFLVRTLDDKAAGFRTVTTEIRKFTEKLHGEISKLTLTSGGLVQHISERVKRARQHTLLNAAIRASNRLTAFDLSVDEKSKIRQSESLKKIVAHCDELEKKVRDLGKICQIGEYLALHATFEAAGVADANGRLKMTSEQMRNKVASMEQSLRNVCECIDGLRRIQ